MDLSAGDLSRMYRQIRIEDRRKEAREYYLAQYPYMIRKDIKYMSWEDYWDRVSGQNIDLRPASEILAEVAEIREEFAKEGG